MTSEPEVHVLCCSVLALPITRLETCHKATAGYALFNVMPENDALPVTGEGPLVLHGLLLPLHGSVVVCEQQLMRLHSFHLARRPPHAGEASMQQSRLSVACMASLAT